MSTSKTISRFMSVLLWLGVAAASISAQSPSPEPTTQPRGYVISLAHGRFEVELPQGSETTVVVNLDYHSTTENSQPVRIVASLNDWTIDRDGQVQFAKAGTLPGSASSWLI
jgi:hypothetical protein